MYKRNFLPFLLITIGLVQTGTTAPVATVKHDNAGSNLKPAAPVIARPGVGVYTVTKTGLFPANTSAFFTNNVLADGSVITVQRTSANVLTIKTYNSAGAAADAILGAGGIINDLVIHIYQ